MPQHTQMKFKKGYFWKNERGFGGGGLWSLNNTGLNCGAKRSSQKHQYSRHLNALPTCLQIKKRYGAPIPIHHNNSQYYLVNHVDS